MTHQDLLALHLEELPAAFVLGTLLLLLAISDLMCVCVFIYMHLYIFESIFTNTHTHTHTHTHTRVDRDWLGVSSTGRLYFPSLAAAIGSSSRPSSWSDVV
jgi:hypothetical protein